MIPFIANFISMGRITFSLPLFTSGLLLVMAVFYTVVKLVQLGAFTKAEGNPLTDYRIMATVEGPEALQIDQEAEILYFISNNPCRVNPAIGSIYLVDLNNQNAEAKQLAIPLTDFQPHGLSFFYDETGKYLFTNNHRVDGKHTVEIFQLIAEDTLTHLRTVTSELLSSPNDLVAIAPDKFYVTNDGRGHDNTTRAIDAFLGRKTGSVLFHDGKELKMVVDNLYFPNGIALNKMSKILVIGETLAGNVVFYRMEDNYDLKYVDKWQIGRGIDNISWSNTTGDFYIARHLNLFQLSKHRKNVDKLSGFEIVIAKYKTKGLNRLIQSKGEVISGVSSVVIHNDRMFLGAVCDNALLELEIPTEK